MGKSGVVSIRGKEYRTVALRVKLFHEYYASIDGIDGYITTDILNINDDSVLVKAFVGSICGGVPVIHATGHAHERFDDGMINKTSAIENCETSAVGRALAMAGYGGDELCSADELVRALEQQKRIEKTEQSAGMRSTGPDGLPCAEDPPNHSPEEISNMRASELEEAFDNSLTTAKPENWDERDLLEMIRAEADRGCKVLGDEIYTHWHNNMLLNRWGVRTLASLAKQGKDKLAFFLKEQRERIKIEEEKDA